MFDDARPNPFDSRMNVKFDEKQLAILTLCKHL